MTEIERILGDYGFGNLTTELDRRHRAEQARKEFEALIRCREAAKAISRHDRTGDLCKCDACVSDKAATEAGL